MVHFLDCRDLRIIYESVLLATQFFSRWLSGRTLTFFCPDRNDLGSWKTKITAREKSLTAAAFYRSNLYYVVACIARSPVDANSSHSFGKTTRRLTLNRKFRLFSLGIEYHTVH